MFFFRGVAGCCSTWPRLDKYDSSGRKYKGKIKNDQLKNLVVSEREYCESKESGSWHEGMSYTPVTDEASPAPEAGGFQEQLKSTVVSLVEILSTWNQILFHPRLSLFNRLTSAPGSK